jgi:hypothetical protein
MVVMVSALWRIVAAILGLLVAYCNYLFRKLNFMKDQGLSNFAGVTHRVPPLFERRRRSFSPPLTRRGGAEGDGAVWGMV